MSDQLQPVTEATLTEIENLIPFITPLPYFVIPEGINRSGQPYDATIAFGNPNDGRESWDLIEHYEAEVDYPYLVACANAAPSLVAEIRRLRAALAAVEGAGK